MINIYHKIKENGKPVIYISRKESATLGGFKEEKFKYNQSNLIISESKISNPRTKDDRSFVLVVRLDGDNDKYKMSQMSFDKNELLVLKDSIDEILNIGKEKIMSNDVKGKPPIGIMPKYIWDKQRINNLQQAIERYMVAGYNVPFELVDEYNDLVRLYKDKE